ncbi:zinc finger and SCAN domain-containing protein 2-like [Vanessa atalanta]|uniref:zinc finger and SCAN domain-containing protein 2-like n=1 Tax=Vanessa atalanta TaxID=42275 RepID=UPI001FCDCE89|nr:zinc finger and SCAN domain-containing protein 2-like [Vanessa atalanta]
MAESLETFERCCRLCAEEQEVTIMIFSKEAEAMLLQNKLNKYLLIEVEEDDKLPKNICVKCCSKLQTVCDFIDTARKAQDVLQNQSMILEQTEEITKTIKANNVEPDYGDDIKYTAMEVNVDPMMVLQNSEDSILPDNEENSESIEQDVTYLHGVDGEDVTIKLIKKGDKTCDPNDDKKDTTKPFQCITCNRGFFTELALKNHSWTHFNEDRATKPYKCSSCREQFDYKSELLIHLKLHRTSGMCLICGRIFRTDKNLAAHMAAHSSSTSKSYVCKVCGRSYNTSSNLKTHSVTHSTERPYKCHYCKKSFKRNQDLKFHINQHTGAKPYKCPFCEKSFASSGNCYSHKSRMHPGRRVEVKKRRATISRENQPLQPRPIAPKPTLTTIKASFKYQCTLCDHSFHKRDNYTYHMYQHTGEKPFQCSFCSEKFVTRKGLLLHHDKCHPGKDRPLALLSRNALLK